MGDLGLIPELGRSPGEGKGYPLQIFSLENSRDCTVHGVTKSRTRLSDLKIYIYITTSAPKETKSYIDSDESKEVKTLSLIEVK